MRSRYLSSPSSPSPLFSTATGITRATSRFPSKELWIAFAVALSGIMAGVMLFSCLKSQCSLRKRRPRSANLKKIDLRRFRMEELERATMSFSKECLVGSGAFGNVYRGVFDDEKVFAIKRSHVDSYQSVQEFRNEVELLSRVKHMNLVSLYGYCEEQNQKILVYEYVPHGSLLEYIVGIAHLHEAVKPSIIHRDIKPSNILIGDRFEAKVSDFGLVKLGPIGDASHVSSQIKGTPGYLDPSYCASLHLTPFSDVYSFGIILLQLVTARPAVASSRAQSRYHIVDWARPSLERGTVEEIIDANLLMEPCNMEMMLKMGQLGLRCVVKSPKNRPTISQVVRELEEALQDTRHYGCMQPVLVPHERNLECMKTPIVPYQTVEEVDHEIKEHAKVAHQSVEKEDAQSFSINGVGLEKFLVENDGFSINSATMQCFEVSSSSVNEAEELKRFGFGAEGR